MVENLGVNLLVGEPGKLDNNILTDSAQRIVKTLDSFGRQAIIKYLDKLPVMTRMKTLFVIHI